MKYYRKTRVVIIRLLSLLIILGLWQLNSKFLFYKIFFPEMPPTFFPSLGKIFKSIIIQVSQEHYLNDLSISLTRILFSFFLATFFGILVGLFAARFKLIEDLNYLAFEFFRQIPGVAIIPFALLIFGIGAGMKIFVGFFGCFFPIYLTTVHSLQNVDSILLKTAKTYGWSGSKLIFKIMLPAALPGIISILRVSLSIALILIITSEMLVGGEGLGARIILKERSFDFTGLYAETFMLGIVGLVMNYFFLYITNKMIFWKDKSEWNFK